MYIKPPGHKTGSVPWMRLPWHPQINSFPVILCVLLNMTSFAYIQSNDIIYFHDCGKCCYAQIPFCPLPPTHKRQFPRICQTKHCFSIGWQPCLSQTSTSSGLPWRSLHLEPKVAMVLLSNTCLVLCSHSQPHPVGQRVSDWNQSIMWVTWPPWPHDKQKEEEPVSGNGK